MGMPKRIPVKTPPAPIPKSITLPDGRSIDIATILIKPRNREHYNLLTGKVFSKRTKKPVDTADKP